MNKFDNPIGSEWSNLTVVIIHSSFPSMNNHPSQHESTDSYWPFWLVRWPQAIGVIEYWTMVEWRRTDTEKRERVEGMERVQRWRVIKWPRFDDCETNRGSWPSPSSLWSSHDLYWERWKERRMNHRRTVNRMDRRGEASVGTLTQSVSFSSLLSDIRWWNTREDGQRTRGTTNTEREERRREGEGTSIPPPLSLLKRWHMMHFQLLAVLKREERKEE